MTKAILEHVNVTVKDPDQTAAILGELFGWQVRWHGASIHGGRTVHVGTSDQYLAVYSMADSRVLETTSYTQVGGLNHLGIVVADLDATERRVKAAGFTTFNHGDYDPGRRFYFRDNDGIEFEVVSYAGDQQ